MSTSTLTAALAAAALASGIGSTSAAFAWDQDTVSRTVNYRDLDLSTRDGAETMLQRIRQAAARVCEPDADVAELPGLGGWLDYCISSRVEDTVKRLHAPMVTAALRSQVTLAERGER